MGDAVTKSSGILATAAPFTGPAAPVLLLAASLMNLGDSIYHLFSRYDPQKLHDTAVVEAFEMSVHNMWYAWTGEALPGIEGVTPSTTPGNYGSAGINLFQESAYPNVPYPAGIPGIDPEGALNSLQATFEAAAQQMVRPESIPNLRGNLNYFMPLFQRVAAASASGSPISGDLGGVISSVPAVDWILAAGFAAALWLRKALQSSALPMEAMA